MVNVKGNDWNIRDNRGLVAAQDGFRTEKMVEGWAWRNVFTAAVSVHGPGYGYNLLPINVLRCDSTATSAVAARAT